MTASGSPKFRGAAVDVVVDVRSKLEFWLGHLPGAVCIPVDRILAGLQAIDGISATSRILVYCASGNRSRAAAATLAQAGYRNVVDGGGLTAASAHYTP
jgi:rhodanese-related sulfurtransferase